MSELQSLLTAFGAITGREVALWERREGVTSPALLAASSEPFATRTRVGTQVRDVASWAATQGLQVQRVTTGERVGWLFLEGGPEADADRLLGRVLPMVRHLVHEGDALRRDVAARDEELGLLYAIGEQLGGSTSVEEVAPTVLAELAATIGAPRAVCLTAHRLEGVLRPIASLGLEPASYPAVPFDADGLLAARVFRTGGTHTDDGIAGAPVDPVLAPPGAPSLGVAIQRPTSGLHITGSFAVPSLGRRPAPAVPPFPTGATPADRPPLGVLLLAGRRGDPPFSDRDRTLALAVARQLGTAMHNNTLVRAATERQQLVRELQLAHDLQLKLLPDPAVVGPEARAAARVEPAANVGGDFYLLARLDRDRTGVLIGDVSGHGYPSALMMALALSAAAIHVQAAFDPARAVESVQRSLQDELDATDMSVSLCYAVIDLRAGELRYANAGHPHCFRQSADGRCARMAAIAPPIGFAGGAMEESVMRWRRGDRLVFFTDGVVDARNARQDRLGEAAVLAALEGSAPDASPAAIMAAVFAQVEAHVGSTPLQDDCTVVVVDRP